MKKTDKIYIAGHKGLVGSAFVRTLTRMGYDNLLLRTRAELDLMDQVATMNFFQKEKPSCVILAAAKVGGIAVNNAEPAEFIYENLIVQCNVIHSAFKASVERMLFLGSSCIYPRDANQPIREEYLMTGKLEPTNEPYAVAKIAGLKMCEAYNRQYGTHFVTVMPCNLYGPNDNFDLRTSHALPAIIRKFYEAKVAGLPKVEMWGTGSVRREFLYVDDLAEAGVFILESCSDSEPINIGSGKDVTISELVHIVREEVGYEGDVVWDRSRPDGTPQKLLSIDKIQKIGWSPRIGFRDGIRSTVSWYRDNRGRILETGR